MTTSNGYQVEASREESGVPEYVQYGKSVRVFMRLVRVHGGAFWTIQQPQVPFGCACA